MNETLAALEAKTKAKIDLRERRGWSRNIGAGFIGDDIESITPENDHAFILQYSGGHRQRFDIEQLNLRELDAVQKWLFAKLGEGNKYL